MKEKISSILPQCIADRQYSISPLKITSVLIGYCLDASPEGMPLVYDLETQPIKKRRRAGKRKEIVMGAHALLYLRGTNDTL